MIVTLPKKHPYTVDANAVRELPSCGCANEVDLLPAQTKIVSIFASA
jgi:hypothetical protein